MTKSIMRCTLVFGLTAIVLWSCTLKRFMPLSTGEMKLIGFQVPDEMEENLPYDVLVNFESDGEPAIRRVCFHWYSEKTSMPAPSLYCFTYEVTTNQPTGSYCTRWLGEGPYSHVSPLVCAKPYQVVYGSPGQLTVRLQSSDMKSYYNKLECYAEYLHDGTLKDQQGECASGSGTLLIHYPCCDS